jgi:hypothetical protein
MQVSIRLRVQGSKGYARAAPGIVAYSRAAVDRLAPRGHGGTGYRRARHGDWRTGRHPVRWRAPAAGHRKGAAARAGSPAARRGDAHLDPRTEAALDEVLSGRRIRSTVLVVAHRLDTIRGADAIVVLDRGRVRVVGRHDELLGSDGLYHSLVAAGAGVGEPGLT